MATVVLEGVNKVYENGYHAIHDLDLVRWLLPAEPSANGPTSAGAWLGDQRAVRFIVPTPGHHRGMVTVAVDGGLDVISAAYHYDRHVRLDLLQFPEQIDSAHIR